VLVSVILTIIVLNFHFRGPKRQRVPKWMRKYVIGYLGRVFCFSHESKLFYHRKEQNKKEIINENTLEQNIQKQKEKSGNFFLKILFIFSLFILFYLFLFFILIENENDFVIDVKSEPAYVKLANNRLEKSYSGYKLPVSLLSIEAEEIIEEEPIYKTSSKHRSKSVRASTAATKKNEKLPLEEEISKNLEKMLIKMQRSFDPFKLHDENLKFSILKEILECQRLLLASNLRTANAVDSSNQSKLATNLLERKEPSTAEIYDEWKVLAMIVDRICFFIYLAALLVSSAVFFYKENLYNEQY
jgi:hypothetical protein